MKKIGQHTIRGQMTENDLEGENGRKINLFDGRYDTAYKVTAFYIWGGTYSNSSNPDVAGKLAVARGTTSSSVNFMDAEDMREIGWAGSNGGLDVTGQMFSGIVDRENLVVEDLYVYVRGVNDDAPVNYMIELDKYKVDEWLGTQTVARNYMLRDED